MRLMAMARTLIARTISRVKAFIRNELKRESTIEIKSRCGLQ